MYKKNMCILFALCSFLLHSETKRITLASLEWEPYIGSELTDNGYVAEIVKEAFLCEGYELEILFYPWARTFFEAKNGNVSGYFPEYYSKEREEQFIFSDPFKGGPLGFFKKKNTPIQYKNLSDLKNYTIGTVRGYINTDEFDHAVYLKTEEAVNDLTNLKKLLTDRIDLFIADKFVGLSLYKLHFPNNPNEIEFLTPPLEEKYLYVCFSKELPESKLKAAIFNSGLKKITADGTLDNIIAKHGF